MEVGLKEFFSAQVTISQLNILMFFWRFDEDLIHKAVNKQWQCSSSIVEVERAFVIFSTPLTYPLSLLASFAPYEG